jgi:hypothetical protein
VCLKIEQFFWRIPKEDWILKKGLIRLEKNIWGLAELH